MDMEDRLINFALAEIREPSSLSSDCLVVTLDAVQNSASQQQQDWQHDERWVQHLWDGIKRETIQAYKKKKQLFFLLTCGNYDFPSNSKKKKKSCFTTNEMRRRSTTTARARLRTRTAWSAPSDGSRGTSGGSPDTWCGGEEEEKSCGTPDEEEEEETNLGATSAVAISTTVSVSISVASASSTFVVVIFPSSGVPAHQAMLHEREREREREREINNLVQRKRKKKWAGKARKGEDYNIGDDFPR